MGLPLEQPAGSEGGPASRPLGAVGSASGSVTETGPVDLPADLPAEPARQSPLIRFFDVVLATFGLIIGSPLLLLVVVAILLRSGRPVFFFQERLGWHRVPFSVVKFRTMVVDAEADGPQWAQEDDDRITPEGRLLRMTRLDELPQLWNVLRGDMGFVGPRPIRAYFADQLEEMDPRYAHRFLVRPGVTGWAQLYAPYGSTLEEQLEKLPYDLRYLREGLTLGQYWKIIVLTAVSVFRAEGV